MKPVSSVFVLNLPGQIFADGQRTVFHVSTSFLAFSNYYSTAAYKGIHTHTHTHHITKFP